MISFFLKRGHFNLNRGSNVIFALVKALAIYLYITFTFFFFITLIGSRLMDRSLCLRCFNNHNRFSQQTKAQATKRLNATAGSESPTWLTPCNRIDRMISAARKYHKVFVRGKKWNFMLLIRSKWGPKVPGIIFESQFFHCSKEPRIPGYFRT